MKKSRYLVFTFILVVIMPSCKNSFLNLPPQGIMAEDQLLTPDNANKMVIAAYAAQGNERYALHPLTPWPYGDLRSDDAYKGGAGIGDNPEWNLAETFVNMTPDDNGIEGLWSVNYGCISRANLALSILDKLTDDEMPDRLTRIAEMRFLRANNYFWLKLNFDRVPYIDESVPIDKYNTIGNDLSEQQLWNKITDDFRFAVVNLPSTQSDVGRPTKYAAEAYLAKCLLYKAYEKNSTHQVTNINKDTLNKVITLCQDVIKNSGKELFAHFSDNFRCSTQNGSESIWAIQFSNNDGTPHGRINGTNEVCYPMVEEYGCCGYHAPSQNLVNAFRTVDGLPDFDHFNEIDMTNGRDVKKYTIDPRLLHTVAMDGLPYKYKVDFIFNGKTWTRQPETYGEYLSMKECVIYDAPCYTPVNPWKSSSLNRDVIRLDDVILWEAEALIQLGHQDDALPLINEIRNRAAESITLLKDANGNPTGNFDIKPYIPGVNCVWTQDFAFEALQWERRLEFACEGFRAYDLMRWGIMSKTLNTFFVTEKLRHDFLKNAYFTAGRDEFLPIPKTQINLSQGLYVQNNGYK